MASPSSTVESAPSCLFCKIGRGEDTDTTLLFQDEEYAVFNDIHPAAKHHYLVIPRKHIRDPKSLTYTDIPLIQKLCEVGKRVLQQRGGDAESLRLGFHWPPFNSVPHLHMHVISPANQLSLLAKVIYMPGSLWFCTAEDTIAYLEKTRPAASL